MSRRPHLTAADSSARLERLLLRWPKSPRLRRALADAKAREEREARRTRETLVRAIRDGLSSADLPTLQRVSDLLMEATA